MSTFLETSDVIWFWVEDSGIKPQEVKEGAEKACERFSFSISGSDNYGIYSCAVEKFKTCNLKDLYLTQVTGKAVNR